MAAETVRLEWVRDQVFNLQDRGGYSILMTQPDGANGADLLPLSLIGCSAWDVVAILNKQRAEVTRLEVSATSEQDDDPPWRFRKISILYKFTGRGLKPERIRQAIEISETKYCSIYATLRECVEIESTFEIVEA